MNVGSVLDITPTLLTLKRVPVGEDMDGKVLNQILHPELLSQQRASSVPSHDTPQWRAARPKLQPGQDVDPEREEQLRALGYIQ